MRRHRRLFVACTVTFVFLAGLAIYAGSAFAEGGAQGPAASPQVIAQQSNACAGLTVAEMRKKTIKTIPCWNICAGIGGPEPTDAQLQACIDNANKPKAAPTPAPTATTPAARPRVDFDYAPVVMKPGDSVTFVDKTTDPAGGQLQRKWYVDGNAQATGEAKWTWKVPDGKPHGIKLVVTSDKSKQSAELEKTVGQATKSLCAEAIGFFGDPGSSGILLDGADLRKDFERAVERYRQDPTAANNPPRFGLTYVGLLQQKQAIEWLAAYGGTGSAQNLVALPEGQADNVRKAIQRENLERQRGNSPQSVWPAGTEPALRQSIIDYYEKANAGITDPAQRKGLSPGDVFYLALQQRQGEAKEAMLLAHNTLRSLTRAGDEAYTGLDRDPAFVDTYLQPLRQGENGGPYYHLFGTAYFEAQNQANWNPLFWMSDNALTQPVAEAFLNWKGWDLPGTDTSLLSELANTYEQIVRESAVGGNQKPDPEKYCFNVWGGQIAKALYKSGLKPTPPPPAPVPAQYIQDWDKEVSLSNPEALKSLGAKKVDCPVNVTWEGNGYKMTLDQRTGTTYGFYPIVALPYQEVDGSWGMAWVDVDPRPYKLSFEAVGKGELSFTAVEQDARRWAQYAQAVSPGDKYALDVKPGQVPGAMKSPSGGSLAPTVGELGAIAPGGSDDPDWLLVAGGFVVGGVAIVLVKRARKPGKRPAPLPMATSTDPAARGEPRPVVPVARPPAPPPAVVARPVGVAGASPQAPGGFCVYCGQALPEGARFCHGCGKAVT